MSVNITRSDLHSGFLQLIKPFPHLQRPIIRSEQIVIARKDSTMDTVEKTKPERGYELLRDPSRNKDTAFTPQERQEYGLVGLLPDTVETLDLQVDRVLEQLEKKTPIEQ